MFKGVAFGLLALLGAASPASAQMVSLTINGVVNGTQTTVLCGPSNAMTCPSFPMMQVSDQFFQAFDLPIVIDPLVQGDNLFSWGSPTTNGLWRGTIVNSGGFLTGQNLTYSRASANCPTAAVGCQYVFASAAAFDVTSAIPEPGTWATMLLGFALAGAMLRKKAVRTGLVKQQPLQAAGA